MSQLEPAVAVCVCVSGYSEETVMQDQDTTKRDEMETQSGNMQPKKEELKDVEPGQKRADQSEESSKESKEDKGKEGGQCCGG